MPTEVNKVLKTKCLKQRRVCMAYCKLDCVIFIQFYQ